MKAGHTCPHGTIIPHGSRIHPQFLHHRAHRSWQIYAGRPAARSHRRAAAARNDGAGPRHHGPGARARHHHQSPRRAPELSAPDDGKHVPTEPDRHARPRGFFLRSVAQPASLRRRAAGGGRLAGRGGADPRQYLPGAAPQPGDHSGHQQDRLARRRAGAHPRADRIRDRPGRFGRAAGERQAGHRRARSAGGHRAPGAAAQGDCPSRRCAR